LPCADPRSSKGLAPSTTAKSIELAAQLGTLTGGQILAEQTVLLILIILIQLVIDYDAVA
jgi:hypothetical protein